MKKRIIVTEELGYCLVSGRDAMRWQDARRPLAWMGTAAKENLGWMFLRTLVISACAGRPDWFLLTSKDAWLTAEPGCFMSSVLPCCRHVKNREEIPVLFFPYSMLGRLAKIWPHACLLDCIHLVSRPFLPAGVLHGHAANDCPWARGWNNLSPAFRESTFPPLILQPWVYNICKMCCCLLWFRQTQLVSTSL